MEIGVAEDGGPIAAEAKLVRPGAAKGGVGAGRGRGGCGGEGRAGAGRGRVRSSSGLRSPSAPGGRAGCRRTRSVGLVGVGGRRSTGDPEPEALADAEPDTALRRSEPGEPPSLVEAMVRKSTGAASISLVPRLCRETEGRSVAGGCSAEEPQLTDHNASLLSGGGVRSSGVAAQSAASFRASSALSPPPWNANMTPARTVRAGVQA